MIDRYSNPQIAKIFSDGNKVKSWQDVELANIKALENLGKIPIGPYEKIFKAWEDNPIDLDWWKARDEEIHHDLNAFIDERMRFIDPQLHQYVHKNITSFDTEEPAFHRMLLDAVKVVDDLYEKLRSSLRTLASDYRYTIMMGRTHGQEAELQSFGSRVLTWIVDLEIVHNDFDSALQKLHRCKLSGAIGKYGSIDPIVEEEALKILGFKPLYGATQIIPRSLQVPLAQTLCNLVLVIDKIGTDIRLASRSGLPLMQEPFGKKQKGSSAMAHKKNTIRTEQLEGMSRMAKGFCTMLVEGIKTWEERAIEQSSAERVAWPDLFHAACQALKVLNLVESGLKVYPDNMLTEVYRSRGVYASSEVKEFLKGYLSIMNATYEDAYRIVQLACFNVFEPSKKRLAIRDSIPASLKEANVLLNRVGLIQEEIISIEDFIPEAKLQVSDSLEANQDTVDNYNVYLKAIFQSQEALDKWHELFQPEFLLKNEAVLYKNILGA